MASGQTIELKSGCTDSTREHRMLRFRSPGSAQRFLSNHDTQYYWRVAIPLPRNHFGLMVEAFTMANCFAFTKINYEAGVAV
jgi:hypothetical protein